MFTVEVRNFQSIEHVFLQIEGFTALVGKSNIGKSALVRALKAALTNELGNSFVRHERSTCARTRGAKSCKCYSSVHIVRHGEAFDLLWEKGESKNGYVFNGTKYDKPGQGVPEFLVEAGMAPIKLGDQEKTVQIADQFFPIFLLDQSGPAAAEVISDVARLDKISFAMKASDKDRRESIATRKIRAQDLLSLEVKLLAYQGLDEAHAKAVSTQKTLKVVESQVSKVGSLESYVKKTTDLSSALQYLAKGYKIPVPSDPQLQVASKKLQRIIQFQTRLTTTATGYKALLGAEGLPSPSPIEPVRESLQGAKRLNAWVSKLGSLRDAVRKMDSVEDVPVPEVEFIAKARTNLKPIAGYILKLGALGKDISLLEREQQEAEDESIRIKKELDVLGSNCPTCHQPVLGHSHA